MTDQRTLKIQSREPSGWRAAERRRGWRCRGYSGGRGRGGRSCAISLPGAQTTVSPSLQLGVSGPGAERPHLASLPGRCAPGPQGDAAGAALATCGGVGKALSLRRVPGVGPWKGPWGYSALRRICGFSSPSRLPFLPSSRGPRRWGGGGKGGGHADLAGSGAGAPELGESEALGREGRGRERGGRRWGGLGCWEGDSPFPYEWRGVPLPRGTPTQPFPTLRTKGLGSTVGVWERRWREAGRQEVGAGECASPRFLSRPNDGKLPPANASLRPLLNPGGLGFLT
uniref:myosin heavy chain IB-like n=1 Tax=Callithrix jacchus TaxID=9483 RepID=UPI0023DD5D22|nr:myosin heavy chain IB-like [Callithrix jacchus]